MQTNKEQTVILRNKPAIVGHYSMVGPIEGKGPMGKYFDYIFKHDKLHETTFEKSERKLLENIIHGTIKSANMTQDDIQLLISGDLLNQIVSSSYSARLFNITFLGIYSACATMAESLALAGMLVDGGYFNNVCCATASHFSSAERQYRFPLELGNQRPPTSQWTVTGGGGSIIAKNADGPHISSVTLGKVIDFGIKDPNNMGAAMAPAAASTLKAHFENTKTSPKSYDQIFTGDLGKLGSEILCDLLEREGIKLGQNYSDCGNLMYDKNQKTFMGGSGSGCSASIFNSFIIQKLKMGEYKKILLVSTGALLSTTTSQQGDSIPCIAHAVCIESNVKPDANINSKSKNKHNKTQNKIDKLQNQKVNF